MALISLWLTYPAKLTTGYYRVRKSWSDAKSQLGAYRVLIKNRALTIVSIPIIAGENLYNVSVTHRKYITNLHSSNHRVPLTNY